LELRSIGDIAATWAIGAEDIEMRKLKIEIIAPNSVNLSHMISMIENSLQTWKFPSAYGPYGTYSRLDMEVVRADKSAADDVTLVLMEKPDET